jgi:hypothetical protein
MNPIANRAQISDRNTIQCTRNFNVSMDKVWQAISAKPELDKWFMSTEIDLRVRGRYAFHNGWDGWIGELSPFDHIQFNTSGESFTRFEVKKGNMGVRFTLIDKLKPEMPLPKGLPSVKGIADHIVQNQPGGIGTH